uniref:Uncharacterized protein n=1 Tax=Oryza glaberrima TaxID=4538 RepID=I1QK00_ORYGL
MSRTLRSRTLRAAARLRGEKTWVAATPRSVFQRGSELGSHIKDRLANPRARVVSGTARAARRRSCLVNASLAAPADDTTTAVTRPSFSAITGPCSPARRASAWCMLPRRLSTLPITGSGVGPGGSRRHRRRIVPVR